MIRVGSFLQVADNSGAKSVLCIRVLASKKVARVGDLIVVSIKKSLPTAKVAAGDVCRAVIVRAKKSYKVSGGESIISFDTNAVVLLNKQGEPIGTRVFGPTDNSLRSKGFMKIVSLSKEVLQ